MRYKHSTEIAPPGESAAVSSHKHGEGCAPMLFAPHRRVCIRYVTPSLLESRPSQDQVVAGGVPR